MISTEIRGYKLIRVGGILHFWLLNETDFVWLNTLTGPVNNPRNILLINLNIILYHVLFIKCLWIYKRSLVSIRLKSTEKKLQIVFNTAFLYYLL